MRVAISLIVSLLSSNFVLAQSAISLSPIKGDNSIHITEAKNITGSCGTSIIRVMGVTSVNDKSFGTDSDSEGIIIRSSSTKELILGSESGILSDHNGIACVSTKMGNRLLIWSNCGGSACGDEFSFFVIDPEQLVFLAPRDPYKELCNEECASRLLGNRLPYEINQW